jgi:hypothetical protein
MEVDVFEAQLGAVWGALWHSTPRGLGQTF